MTRRGRRLTVALGTLVLFLFAGRWTALVLTDRWWAAEISPGAVSVVTGWNLLRAALALAGILVAGAWFIGHLLIVYRAVGSVQVRRNVANLEFREALTPGALLAVTVTGGAMLGLLVGRQVGHAAREVALGWQGITYGVTEPLLQLDVGLYVAQLPLWRAVHHFAFLLVIIGLGVVFGLYLLVGAIRWIGGRPAINSHARSHLGWLLVTLALVLMWGYLLEPYELIAGLGGVPDRALWRATVVVAPVLAGVALATAILSAVWAVRARHALAAAGWIVLPIASLVGHWMAPAMVGGEGDPVADARTLDMLGRMAYGLESLADRPSAAGSRWRPPVVPSLWSPGMVVRTLSADSVDVVAVNPAVVRVRGRAAPVWLAARRLAGGRLSVSALADDRTGPSGEPLFYRAQDSVPVPLAVPFLDLGDGAFHAQAPPYRVGRGGGPGVALRSWPRRMLLAWALQAPELLGSVPADARVSWDLNPRDRLSKLAPFAEWSEPVARIVSGELLWIADGYLPVTTFPLSQRLPWERRRIGGLRAALVGTVSAEGGATHVYLRHGADPLAAAWASVARGVIEPAVALPDAIWRTVPYPAELLRVQGLALEHATMLLGVLAGRATPETEAPRPDLSWDADTTGPVLALVFERPGDRRVSALLTAEHQEESDALRLTRFDSASAMASASALEGRWGRFPSFDALNDSVREEGGTLEHGAVRFDLSTGSLVAYQPHYAGVAAGRLALVWVSVASGDRQGAGRTLAEAWSNLLGASVPTVPGQAQASRLEEARRLILRADSALRTSDWETFGRAWGALRNLLGIPSDSGAQ